MVVSPLFLRLPGANERNRGLSSPVHPRPLLPGGTHHDPEVGEARFAGVWEKKEGGPAWQARHNQTADEYQKNVTDLRKTGYRPIVANGFAVGKDVRFSAIWIKD